MHLVKNCWFEMTNKHFNSLYLFKLIMSIFFHLSEHVIKALHLILIFLCKVLPKWLYLVETISKIQERWSPYPLQMQTMQYGDHTMAAYCDASALTLISCAWLTMAQLLVSSVSLYFKYIKYIVLILVLDYYFITLTVLFTSEI